MLSGEGPDEDSCFAEFAARYRQEYSVFHDFLVSFYDLHTDHESYFWKAKKVTNNSASPLQSFAELVGGGSSGETGLVDAGAYADAPLFRSEAVETLLQEGAKIQVQAVLGDIEEEPIRDGGLVASADGMHWTWPA